MENVKLKRSELLLVVILNIASLMLLIYDKPLFVLAFYHWLILLLFVSTLDIVTLLRHILKNNMLLRYITYIEIVGVVMMPIGILLDGLLGFPISKIQGSSPLYSLEFLFGFGLGSSGSSVLISSSVIVLSIGSLILAYLLKRSLRR
ncbi:MAG: hypothetical protein ARM1_0801 [Candidatus Micrarchaeota archaeon]|nr:MAG: hypothetical protein ARM1_0801 [Candidatus Micrarchaeota archaeon]